MPQSRRFDVVIVGGGPAGLTAALMLGRCCRSVLLCDDGHPRNGCSRAAHGVFTRDGTMPAELRRLGREQLQRYGTEIRDVSVTDVERIASEFVITLATGERVLARKLLLATGVVDDLPDIPGLEAMHGNSVFHCPYCDAWEVREKPLAVIGSDDAAAEFAVGLRTWTTDVMLFTNGLDTLTLPAVAMLSRNGIDIWRGAIEKLDGPDGMLRSVVLRRGRTIPRQAVFLHGTSRQRSSLPERLGCKIDRSGAVETGDLGLTRVPGVFVAGDADRDVQWISIAAAEGAKAALAINRELRLEDFP